MPNDASPHVPATRAGHELQSAVASADTADALYGIGPIAVFLNVPRDRVRYWVKIGAVPYFRIGRTVAASRATLRAWLAEREIETRAEREARAARAAGVA